MGVAEWIRSCSPQSEVLIVIGVAFGWPMLMSVLGLVVDPADMRVSDGSVAVLIGFELVALGLVAAILRLRGWRIADLPVSWTARQLVEGVLVFLASYLAYVVGYTVTATVLAPLAPFEGISTTDAGVSWPFVLLLAAVNPLFEELLVVGYLITALERLRTTAFAVNASVAIRICYHLYQGAPGVIGAFTTGMVFALVFVRWRRLWPLVVAQAMYDLLALATMIG